MPWWQPEAFCWADQCSKMSLGHFSLQRLLPLVIHSFRARLAHWALFCAFFGTTPFEVLSSASALVGSAKRFGLSPWHLRFFLASGWKSLSSGFQFSFLGTSSPLSSTRRRRILDLLQQTWCYNVSHTMIDGSKMNKKLIDVFDVIVAISVTMGFWNKCGSPR